MKKWRTINGLNNYEMTNNGEIRWTNSKKFVHPYIDPLGYNILSLKNDNGKWITKRLHHVVAENYMDEYSKDKKMKLFHRDGDKNNNSIDNLYLRTDECKKINKVKNDREIKYLINKIQVRGWLDIVDVFRLASIHTDIYGDIYTGTALQQIPKMN